MALNNEGANSETTQNYPVCTFHKKNNIPRGIYSTLSKDTKFLYIPGSYVHTYMALS